MDVMCRSRKASEDGVIAMEFALLAPLLLMLLFAIVQFGRAYNVKVELTGAVREGARVLALGSGDAEEVTKAAAPGLDPAAMEVTTSDDPCTSGSPASVDASYDFELEIPFWGSETLTISATGTMRCGG
jgi:Flp pilus assembly protein TadG